MRSFACQNCGQLVFFENTLCLRCSTPLAFVPSRMDMVAFGPDLQRCGNFELAACNWAVEGGAAGDLCRSCALTRTRPADADAEGLEAFAPAEAAKRRLLFELLDLGLPVDQQRLRFDLLSSAGARHDGPRGRGDHDRPGGIR